MNALFQPWQLLFAILCGWVNERRQKTIAFQNAQIETLLQKLGKKRILLTDDQRRVLAVKANAIGQKALMQLTTIVTPHTILRWNREPVAKKWDYSDRRTKNRGRPPIAADIERLVLRFATENPAWGYDRIAGVLANLERDFSDQSVGNILKANGPLENTGIGFSKSTILSRPRQRSDDRSVLKPLRFHRPTQLRNLRSMHR
jgi:putative transposase